MNVSLQYGIGGRTASALAQSAERAIMEGRLAPGGLLPSVRALADALGISAATVPAAYRTLRLRGLLTGEGRRGTRVVLRPPLRLRRPPGVAPGARDPPEGHP